MPKCSILLKHGTEPLLTFHTLYYKNIKYNNVYTEIILKSLKEYSLNDIIHTFSINITCILFYPLPEDSRCTHDRIKLHLFNGEENQKEKSEDNQGLIRNGQVIGVMVLQI